MFNNRFKRRRFQDPATGGEGGQGAGGSPAAGETNTGTPPANPGESTSPKPSDREAELIKEVMKRKDKEKQLAEQLNQVQSQLKAFEGINLDEVNKLLAERKQRETEELEKRGEFDRIRAQMVEEHQSTVSKIKGEAETKVATLSKQLESLQGQITELTIGRAFSESGFIRESLTLTPAKARVVYGAHFEVVDGQVAAYDKPAGAKDRTLLVDGTGQPLSFEKAIAKIIDADPDKDELLRSKIKAGSGSNNDPAAKPAAPKVGPGRDRIAAAIKAGALGTQ